MPCLSTNCAEHPEDFQTACRPKRTFSPNRFAAHCIDLCELDPASALYGMSEVSDKAARAAARAAERDAKKAAKKSGKTSGNGDESPMTPGGHGVALGSAARTATGQLVSEKRARDIKLNAFSISLHGNILVEDTELEISWGNRYGLIGRNGCGKSTLLHVLANREVPIPEHLDVYLLAEEAQPSDMTALQYVIDSAQKEMVRLEALGTCPPCTAYGEERAWLHLSFAMAARASQRVSPIHPHICPCSPCPRPPVLCS